MTKCLLFRRRRGELKGVKCVTVPRDSYSKQYIGEPVASTVLLRSLGTGLEMLEEREPVWMGWCRLLLRTAVSLSPQPSSGPLQPFLKLGDFPFSCHTCAQGPAASSTQNNITEVTCTVAISAQDQLACSNIVLL